MRVKKRSRNQRPIDASTMTSYLFCYVYDHESGGLILHPNESNHLMASTATALTTCNSRHMGPRKAEIACYENGTKSFLKCEFHVYTAALQETA